MPTAGVSAPQEAPAAYTPEQQATLRRFAQLVATWIKRDVDAKLAASRRVK